MSGVIAVICVLYSFLGYDVQRQIKNRCAANTAVFEKWFTYRLVKAYNDLSLPYTYGIVIPFLTKK